MKILLFLLTFILNSLWGSKYIHYFSVNISTENCILQNLQNKKSFTAVISYQDGFIAVGNDGRISRISLNGEIKETENFSGFNFNSLVSTDQIIMAAGENGEVVVSFSDQPFKSIDSGTKNNINTLTSFDDFIIAGTDNGELLIGEPDGFFQLIQLNVKGNITSLSSRKDVCYGVTDEGEIIHSEDGLNWEVFNFNEAYAGFYKPCRFSKILVTENNIAVVGVHNDGSPAVYFSILGNVWTERTLNITDENGMEGYLQDIPNDIYYDQIFNEYYLVCTNGKILILPNCSHCNTTNRISEKDLLGIAYNNNRVIVVGDGFFLKTIQIR